MSEPETNDCASIATAAGYVVAYDPDQLRDRIKSPRTWYERDPLATDDRQAARYAVWPLGRRRGTNSFRVRLSDSLTERERVYDKGAAEPAPLHVVGSKVFVGPLERLPGDGFGERLSRIPDGGDLYPVEPGNYAVHVHVLDWRPDDSFWTEENEPTADAPPDFVVRIEQVDDLPPAPAEVPELLSLLPKKTPTASKDIVTGKTWRSRHRIPVEEKKKPKRRARRGTSTSSGGKRGPRGGVVKVKALGPGELGVGAKVRHPYHGEGEVLFVKEGFPKAKVRFSEHEIKVDKEQLTVI